MIKVIALYLPQYHPTVNNNKWWGEGFTEWMNVAKAKPLFRGHYQPKIPADLGFYDLRLREAREKQVELAKEAGIYGFCYYHYWFGDGHQELELPFNEVLKTGSPDFPFCLCWANESWNKKFWNVDGSIYDSKLLVEQKYLGTSDNVKHFESLLPAFRDKRYIRVDGKLLYMIYKPFDFKDVDKFMKEWNDLAVKNGLEGFYFVAYSSKIVMEHDDLMKLGFSAVCSCGLNRNLIKNFSWLLRKLYSVVFHTPRRCSYKKIYKTFVGQKEKEDNVFPTLIPNWDHTPRSGVNGDLLTDSTPELFEKHAVDVFEHIKHKEDNRKICFLKSWNEWGEGNYMEPDLKYGKGFINSLKSALSKYNNKI